MVRKEIFEEKHNLRGAEGPVYFYHIAEEGEYLGSLKLLARIVIPKGSGIGIHEHTGETEPYYILKGKGEFTNPDGSVQTVGPGDCCIIKEGETHGIMNPYDEDLEFIAVIYLDNNGI